MENKNEIIDTLYVVSFIQTLIKEPYDEGIVVIDTFDKIVEIVELHKDDIDADEVCGQYNKYYQDEYENMSKDQLAIGINGLIRLVKKQKDLNLLVLLLSEINYDIEYLSNYLGRKGVPSETKIHFERC